MVGVHGVGGLVGTILAAVVGVKAFGGFGEFNMGKQLGLQLMAAAITAVYTVVASVAILVVVKAMVGLRVTEQEEILGLDQSAHGESAYND